VCIYPRMRATRVVISVNTPYPPKRSVCLFLSLCPYIYIYICIYIYIIKPTRCTKFSNLFWNKTQRVSDGSSLYHQDFSLYTQQWHMSYRFVDSLRAGSGRNCSSVLILLASCQQTCMTCTIAVCTVKNSR